MTAQKASHPQTEAHIRIVGQNCPTCDQPIPNEKADEVRARLQARDRQLLEAAVAREARRFAAEKQELATRHAELVAKLTSEVAQRVAAARAEERRTVEAGAQQRFTELQKANAERDLAWQEKFAGASRAQQEAVKQYEALKADTEQVINGRVQEAREALTKDHLDKMNVKDAAHIGEKQKLMGKLAELGRQLEKKSAEELGEGAEVKLYDALRREFEDDRVERVGRGNPGADILHTIIHNGRECGRIIYDSKNAQAWRSEYVTKLIQDQTAAKADHAILCVLKFPAESKQITMRDGVIVVNPARAVVIVQLIRNHLIQVSSLRLSKNERARKMAAIYDFITSERCSHLLNRIDSLAESLLNMQAAEIRAHEENWKKQGTHIRTIQKAKGELETEIDRIIATEEETIVV
jgi:hypothetical protein